MAASVWVPCVAPNCSIRLPRSTQAGTLSADERWPPPADNRDVPAVLDEPDRGRSTYSGTTAADNDRPLATSAT